MSNVIPLPTARLAYTPLEVIIRVGDAHYGQVEALYNEGRIKARRVIFDASMLKYQTNFMKTLRDDGVELILDTKAAELAAVSRYQGRPAGAPWSGGVLHLPDQFDKVRCRAFAKAIALEAIEKQFDRVLSPSHFLRGGVLDPWFAIDKRLCQLLRDELDRNGGGHIAIDYTIIIEQSKLREEAVRAALKHQLSSLPFENCVLRASSFGADATAAGIRAFINALDRFHNFGHPVIVDHIAGLAARALLAFGATTAIVHGVDEHSRFKASSWDKALDDGEDNERSGGAAKRVSVPLLDRAFTVPELNSLAKAKGGHGLMVCGDRSCCRSLADMITNAKRHSLTQEARSMDALNRTPDLMRANHFLEKEIAEADRFGRQVKELKPVAAELKLRQGISPEQAAESLKKRVAEKAQRNERIRGTLEDLHNIRGLDAPRASAALISNRVASRWQGR